MFFSFFRKLRRSWFLPKEISSEWKQILDRNVRLSWNMTDSVKEKWYRSVQIIVSETRWEGVDEFEVTDQHKVTIAGQAALMLLGVNDFYFENVSTVILHPASFIDSSQRTQVGQKSRNAGQAWQGGPVILSWSDVLKGGRNEDDARNVVIHEFAHTLDGLDGEMGGNLIFPTAEQSRRWMEVSEAEYQQLASSAKRGRRTFLDSYGGTNKAEFFAVAVETFFEQPKEMREKHTEVFDLLAIYFRFDPRTLHKEL